MWKIASLGAGLAVTGWVKFNAHLAGMGREATLQDYLAMRCGGEAGLPVAGAETSDLLTLAAMHCWGCYALAAGVAMLGFALWQAAWPRLQQLRGR